MSSGDKIAVPTNGHHPALHDDALDAPHHDAAGSDEVPAEPDEARAPMPTVTAGQVIAGFGVVAAVALLVLGRRRGRG